MAKAKSRRTSAQGRIADALFQFGQWRERTSSYAAKQLGLHATDLACIAYILSRPEPVSPKQIIGHLDMSSSSGTALLDRLESAGYIKRIPNPRDRRSLLISLDMEAAAAPIAFYQSLRDMFAAAFQRRTEAEQQIIAEFLEDLSASTVEMPSQPLPAV